MAQLESFVKETFLFQNMALHYKDADFEEEYFSLSSTSDIKSKDTFKVVHIVKPPTVTLNCTGFDSIIKSASETTIRSSSA